MCSQCDNNAPPYFYRDSSNNCQPCDDGIFVTMLLSLAALVLLVYFVRRFGTKCMWYLREAKGIMPAMHLAQMMPLIAAFEFDWPAEIYELLNAFKIFSFDIGLARPECTSRLLRDPFYKFLLTLSLPIVFAVAFMAIVNLARLHRYLSVHLSRKLRLHWAPATCSWASEVVFSELLRKLHCEQVSVVATPVEE